ncbi:hypothetical protein B0A48_00309 [Cryoendolithus antarcticus]|uniref:Pex N-terminal domain-containing protein n=1 Tax=Cryoendolithus antarcticus TaxID=1507870 RepID=A0A1V8TUA9_9PEZI|nr:hypothetical protein B0A48_00309 [Cryoendolithus antarcticus]
MSAFAAAQARIFARHAATSSPPSSPPPKPPSILPTRLNNSLSPVLTTLSNPLGTSPSPRVTQLDAELLDTELLSLLTTQFSEGLKLLNAHWTEDWRGEVELGLKAVLWKLSVWDRGGSYGASLQGLGYKDGRSKDGVRGVWNEATRWQRGLHGLITVGGAYGWGKWEVWVSRKEDEAREEEVWARRAARATNWVTQAHQVAAFAGFLVFLVNGRYRSLTDRLLRLRLVPLKGLGGREVSFEYLNRQLVWHAFTEFLLFLLPLVGVGRWRRLAGGMWKKFWSRLSAMRFGGSAASKEMEEDVQTGELAFLPERTCAICYQDQNQVGGQSEQDMLASAGQSGGIIGSAATDIANPYETIPCGCIYCYICIAQRIAAEEGDGWTCLRCGETAVKACRPWNGDVVEENRRAVSENSAVSKERRGSRKSVAFAEDVEDEKEVDEEDGDETPLSEVHPMPFEEYEEGAEWSIDDNAEPADEPCRTAERDQDER